MQTKSLTFTNSDIRRFKDCRVQWNYSSPIRKSLKPNIPIHYFLVGRAIHEGLAHYYETNKPAWIEYDHNMTAIMQGKHVNEELKTKLESERTMGSYVLKAYEKWATVHDDFKVIQTEERLSIKLKNGHIFSFQFDGLVQKKDGSYWILEFKTTKSFPKQTDHILFDDQCMSYQWAVEEALGLKISGTIYTWLRKKEPTKPRQLKNGGVSKAANIVTTVAAFTDGLNELGLDVTDYVDRLKAIREKQDTDYFLRTEIIVSPKQRKISRTLVEAVTSEMARKEILIYPNVTQLGCQSCHFKEPCYARQLGHSDISIIKEGFKEGSYY